MRSGLVAEERGPAGLTSRGLLPHVRTSYILASTVRLKIIGNDIKNVGKYESRMVSK